MNVRFFDPGRAYLKIKEEVDVEMQRVLASGNLILREDVAKFERNFAKFVGTKYAVGVASGTDALILSLRALGIGMGDKVVVPSYTFRATVEAIHHAGATPVLYDLDGNISLTSAVKAWIPAHIAGEIPPLFPQAVKTMKNKGVAVIEDAAQALGASSILGITACYSFYPAKILGCYGDGGAIATNDKLLYEKLKLMRNHFKGDWKQYGYNSRLDNLQAAVLNIKLKYLPDYIKRRKVIATTYDRELRGVGKPKPRKIYQDYIIVHEDRDGLYKFLVQNGVETMKNEYPFPTVLSKGPQTLRFEAKSLRLPCNQNLTAEEVAYVVKKVNEYAK